MDYCRLRDPLEGFKREHCDNCPNKCRSYLVDPYHFIRELRAHIGNNLVGRFPFLEGIEYEIKV